MQKWKKGAFVSLMTVALAFETMPMNVFATEIKTSLPAEESADSSLNMMSVSENESAREITKEIETEATKEITKTEQMEIPVVTSGENVEIGALGDNDGIIWFYDKSTKTLTVTGEDSGIWYTLSGYETYSVFSSICSDVEHIIFQDCTLKGMLTGMLSNLDFLESVEFINIDTSDVTSLRGMFEGCSSLTSVDVSSFDTSNVMYMGSMFNGCSSLTSVDVSGLDTSNVIEMYGMFQDCSSLTSVDVSSFNTSKVRNMYDMFKGCSSLRSVDVSNFDTSKVTEMYSMFEGCTSLRSVDVSNFDTSYVTEMYGMFKDCSSLTSVDISGLNTYKVDDMRDMFNGCSSLTSVVVNGINTTKVTNMNSMFKGCSSLTSVDISGLDTSNVTDMAKMFEGCSSVTSVNVSGLDTSKVVNMNHMFNGCSSLTSMDVSDFDTSNVIYMRSMFQDCSSLTSIDVSSFDISNVSSMNSMFEGCSSLTSINVSGLDTSKVLYMDRMFTGCSSLLMIHTPSVMASWQNIELPHTFCSAAGNSITALTSTTCNMVLNRVISAPSFGVKGVINGRDVTFNCDTEDAVIYYSSTTSNLTLEDQHVNAGETVTFSRFYGTIYAKAYVNGKWSNASRLVLKIPVVNKPTITQSGSSVTIKTTTPSCAIYYTTDGSTPSPTNGTKVNASICTIPAVSGTVKAIAVRSCFTNSEVVSQAFVTNTVKVPSFGVVGVIGGRTVTFNNQTPGSKIYYSTSSTITARDNCVNSGGSVTFENFYGTIYARTYHNGKWSNVSKLILKIPTVNTPTIEDVSGGRVKIKTTTPSCTIYYTTDGSTPSPTNGRRVSSSSTTVYVGSGKTVKAIAVRSCFTNSAVATGRTR